MVLTHTNTFKKQKATKQYVTRINKKQELASKQETSQRLQKHATEKKYECSLMLTGTPLRSGIQERKKQW